MARKMATSSIHDKQGQTMNTVKSGNQLAVVEMAMVIEMVTAMVMAMVTPTTHCQCEHSW